MALTPFSLKSHGCPDFFLTFFLTFFCSNPINLLKVMGVLTFIAEGDGCPDFFTDFFIYSILPIKRDN